MVLVPAMVRTGFTGVIFYPKHLSGTLVEAMHAAEGKRGGWERGEAGKEEEMHRHRETEMEAEIHKD